jgi:hypothetical protein
VGGGGLFWGGEPRSVPEKRPSLKTIQILPGKMSGTFSYYRGGRKGRGHCSNSCQGGRGHYSNSCQGGGNNPKTRDFPRRRKDEAEMVCLSTQPPLDIWKHERTPCSCFFEETQTPSSCFVETRTRLPAPDRVYRERLNDTCPTVRHKQHLNIVNNIVYDNIVYCL